MLSKLCNQKCFEKYRTFYEKAVLKTFTEKT